MYIPNFRTKVNGVPVLSKIEIDTIAEKCIRDYCPEALNAPQSIDTL